VLRAWDGLGYPRRARALHATATEVASRGWPRDEAGLQALPGIGRYTARALLAFAFEVDAPAPRDTNCSRVAARAGLGVEVHETTPSALDVEVDGARPATLTVREHTYALFDLGATVCLARRPRCQVCPLQTCCASHDRLAAGPPPRPPRRQPAYAGSLRQLRGAVLRAMLADSAPADAAALHAAVQAVPAAARPGAVEAALAGLRQDGLLPG
jgi:A/G-specific adenine glycosylase